jgi:predicted Na+-dependent transporter
VIGGLVVSTLLTLVVIPVLYSLLAREASETAPSSSPVSPIPSPEAGAAK